MSETESAGQAPGFYPEPGTGRMRWWDGNEWGAYQEEGGNPPQTAPAPAGATSGTDPKTMAMLAQVLGIFTGFIGPLIIYVTQDKDPFVRHHATEALNFQITVTIAYVVCFLLAFVLIGFLLLPIVWIGSLVLAIMAAMAANRGEWYRYPVNIRFIKGAAG